MWKPGSSTPASSGAVPAEPTTSPEVSRPPFNHGGSPLMAQPPQAMIGKTMVIKGEVSGAESLYIDGRIEGTIDVGSQYLHVGENASVQAKVNARELVIRGKLQGNVTLGDRLDIRSGGTLVGDVNARRVSIEDGAYFKGSIDMRREQKDQHEDEPATRKDVAGVPAAAQPVAAAAASRG